MAVLHRKMIVQLVVVLFLAATTSKAEVTLGENGYSNLLVSLPANFNVEDGQVLLGSLQDLFENTSRVLNSSLGIPIADVTFLLPDSWITSLALTQQTISVSREDSDIVVESVPENAFGRNPLAVQFGGCGVPGSHITLSPEFLTASEDYPKGKLLAREWLKYRYGVFDENGFPGDPRYPSHYTIPGIEEEVQVTECTHPQVDYVFKDSNGNNCSLLKDPVDTCMIHPGEMSIENVTSSLMYFHQELPNVEHVCGKDHPHNNLGPSKQNILCSEKSIWEVLQESPDFKDMPATVSEYTVAFHYAKERKPKVAVLFETTSHLASKKDELIFALQKLVYDMPEGSHLSLYNFNDNKYTGELRPMSELTDRNIVQNWDFDGSGIDVCPLCAVDKAVDGFPEDKHGAIILIVGSNSTIQDNSALVAKLKKSHLCITVIALRDSDATIDGYSDFLSQLDCQTLVEIPNSDEKMATFNSMYESMISSVPSTYTESSKEVVASGAMSSKNGIHIQSNPRASKFTIWLNRPIFEDNIICKTDVANIAISKSNPQSNTAYTFDPTDKEVTCNLQKEISDPVLTQVQMTTEPGNSFSGSVWIHDPTPEGSKEQLPVVIYVKINYGGYPVSNAVVKATVTNSEGQAGDYFELYDTGLGDPDVTKNDGIYSRYFFQFNKEDTYYVSVEANDNGGTAAAMKNGEDRCCGSQVITQKQEHVPSFTRTFTTKFHTVSAKPEDGYPPSRIMDLHVGEYNPPTLLELKWTAPGGEVDTGKAEYYTLKSFSNRKDALENFNSTGSILNITSPPNPVGVPETLKIALDELLSDNHTHYLALKAIGPTGLEGPASNILMVMVPEDNRTTGEDEITTKAPPPKSSGPDKTTIGIVLGVLVGILVLSVCVYTIIYCVSRGKKSKEAEQDRAKKAEQDRAKRAERGEVRNNASAAGGIGLNSIPADAIVRHHNEVVRAKHEHRDPPIFKEENLVAASSAPERPTNTDEDSPVKPELPAKTPPKSPKRMTVV